MRQDENGVWHDDYGDGPVWRWFGLTYSSYCVLPRRALCSMPLEWQERFVKLMEEAEELLPDEAKFHDYWVRAKDGNRFVEDGMAQYRHAAPFKLRLPNNGD
jgi:hypothetical protein